MDELTPDELTEDELTPDELVQLNTAIAMWRLIELKAEWWNETLVNDVAIKGYSGQILKNVQILIPLLLDLIDDVNSPPKKWHTLSKYVKGDEGSVISLSMLRINQITSRPGTFSQKYPDVPPFILAPFDADGSMKKLHLVESILARFFEPPN